MTKNTTEEMQKAPARGKNPYQNRVIKNVLDLSVENLNYERAKREWEYRGEVLDHGPLKDQIPKPAECLFCGHPIRYGYRLHNTVSQKVVEVGSECIGNFLEITPAIASSLDTDKRAAVKQRKNQQLKMRRAIYIAAHGEVGKVTVAICAAYNTATGCPGNTYRNDRDYILPVGNNAATLYSAITSGEIARLAEKYGVTLDHQKIEAFVEEAGKVKAVNRISAF